MTNVIAVFGRAPEPGQVKTRLAKDIGDEAAAGLYAAMLRDSLALAQRAAQSWINCEVVLVYTPDDAFESGPYSLLPFWQGPRLLQEGRDLGERILHCIGQLRRQGTQHIVVIGSDSPLLPPSYIWRAFQHLGAYSTATYNNGVTASWADLVLGPTPDGGFYLLGVRDTLPDRIFEDVAWSTSHTFAQVVNNAARLALRVWRQSTWDDVDTIEDLRKLARRARAGRLRHHAPATQRWLYSKNLL